MTKELDLTLENEMEPENAPLFGTSHGPSDGQHAWTIGDEGAANWASMRAKEAADEIEKINQWEKDTIAKVKRIAEDNRRGYQRSLDYMTDRLRDYLNTLIENGKQTKSLNLMGGKIQLRERQPKIEVLRDGDAIAWASQNFPSLVKWKASLDKRAFNSHVTLADDGVVVDGQTGEVLDFARWETQDESATFKPEGA